MPYPMSRPSLPCLAPLWRHISLLSPFSHRHFIPYFHLPFNVGGGLLLLLLLTVLFPVAQSYLIFAGLKDIRKFDDTHLQPHRRSNTSVIYDGLEEAVAIDFDYEDRLIFWSDNGFEAISSLRLSPGDPQKVDVISSDIVSPDTIACDWVSKKIYWADSDTNRIEVAHYNGSHRTVLFWNLDQPRAIALVPSEGLIFFADWGHFGKIERASMNGQARQVIASGNDLWANGLTIDYEAKRIYWINAKMNNIGWSDYDGRNQKIASPSKHTTPLGVTLSRQILFWTNLQTKDVHWCNISLHQESVLSSCHRAYVASKKQPTGIAVFEASRQPASESPCHTNNGDCSHLCLLSSEAPHYSCACPTGIRLMEDGRTCPDSPDTMLLLSRRSDLRRISLDTKDYTSVMLPIRGNQIRHATIIDYDPIEGYVYWADDELRAIKRAMLNGSHLETVISSELHHPDGLAIDWINRNLYFTDAGTDRIEVARLNGSSRTILLNEGLDKTRAIVLHPEEGLMFWSDWGLEAKIERAALDGSQRLVIVNTSIVWPNGLAIDYELSLLFWCDAKTDTIEMVRFDGSDRKEVVSNTNSHLFGFTVFNEWIYWTDWQKRSIERVHKLTGESYETIVEQLPDLMGIKAVRTNHQPYRHYPEVNPCANNGNCSHLCLKRSRLEYVCACPTGYELTGDQRECVISQAYFLLLRKNDIRRLTLGTKRFDVVPISGINSATAFDVDVAKSIIYWIDPGKRSIQRSYINGSSTELVVQLPVEAPISLAIDWIANNLYFTDPHLRRIEVIRTDAPIRRVLIHDPKKWPHTLAVDPIVGFLFWIDWSETGSIERAFLDGEKRETLVKEIGQAWSLTLDTTEKRIYWLEPDRLVSCSYGNATKTILPLGGLGAGSRLVLFTDLIYLLDPSKERIESFNKSSSVAEAGVVKASVDLASASDLFMYHPLRQKGWNFCAVNNGSCAHLCFARSSRPLRGEETDLVYCNCATHYRLADDGRECLPPESFLLFSHKNEVTRFLFDQSASGDFQDVTLSIAHSRQLRALAYDALEHTIYWIDGKNASIRRAHLNGTGTEVILEQPAGDLVDLVLDSYSRILYWSCSGNNSINAIRLIGHPTVIGTVYHSATDNPRLLTYHYGENLLFWSNEMLSPQIERISLSAGLAKMTVIADKLHDIIALTVDQELDYLLWADPFNEAIEYSDLEGRRRTTLFAESGMRPLAMTAHSRYLFWIEKERRTIEKVPLDLNMGRNKQTLFGKITSVTDIIAVPPMIRNLSKQTCAEENNGCSHFCLILHHANGSQPQTRCACPKGLVLSTVDGKSCDHPVRCEVSQFACKNGLTCIDAIFRCNGSPDCGDASDETACPKCGPGQFTCLKDVISHEELICMDNGRVCDGRRDCYMGHDELCCHDKFRCNSRHCLTSDQLCDGKRDCFDGEDEEPGRCPRRQPNKTEHSSFSMSLLLILAFAVVLVLFIAFQCKKCLTQEKKEVAFLMTEVQSSAGFAGSSRNSRHGLHRARFPGYNKKVLLEGKHAKQENNNTLTSTTTVSGLETPNEAQVQLLDRGGLVDPGPYSGLHHHMQPLIESNRALSSASDGSSGPLAYPHETINPPPSPATERSQSVYSSYSSSLFVPRSSRVRAKNGTTFTGGPKAANKSANSNRRHKKSRWPKVAATSLRGPPPTPCGTDVYEDLEPSSVKYIYYDNANAEMDEFEDDYQPPPPTPRHYFSDPSCPPSPVTEHSFCNLNLNPPPPSPVQYD